MKNARFSKKKKTSFFKEILADTSTLYLQKKLASYRGGLYLKLANCLVCVNEPDLNLTLKHKTLQTYHKSL